MPLAFSITLDAPIAGGVATLLTLGLATAIARRLTKPMLHVLWALLLLGIAIAEPILHWADRSTVLLVLDTSQSTRGASYCDAASLAELQRRLQLPADTRVLRTADLAAIVGEPADAVVVLTDGRAAMPSTRMPIFPVIDPSLAAASDARLTGATFAGTELLAISHADAVGRTLRVGNDSAEVPAGDTRVQFAVPSDQQGPIELRLTPGDLWPENDVLSVLPPNVPLERLWVGPDAPAGFASVETTQLAGRLAGASVVVLRNTPATQLPTEALSTFLRDWGGTLIVGGGDAAFGAGGYVQSALDAVLPLHSAPPQPQSEWIVLLDVSGSMATEASGENATRLTLATRAADGLRKRLPPRDSLSVASFANDLTWIVRNATMSADITWPTAAGGSTNLDAALSRVLSESPAGTLPRQVVVISDGQTPLPNAASLRELAARSKTTLHWLALDADDSPLATLARDSGGAVVRAGTPRDWESTATQLGQSLAGVGYDPTPTRVTIVGGDVIDVPGLNTTFADPAATPIARTFSGTIAAAKWQLGAGRSVAVAFDSPSILTAQAAEAGETRDPRFTLTSTTKGDAITLKLAARDAGRPMNELSLSAELSSFVESKTIVFEQSAPGEYEATTSRDPLTRRVSVSLNGTAIVQSTLPGQAPAEFDAIGLDRPALGAIASSSGGRVIDVGDAPPQWPRHSRRIPLAATFALAGIALLLATMFRGRAFPHLKRPV